MSDNDTSAERPSGTTVGLEEQSPVYQDSYDPSTDEELGTFLAVTVAKATGVDPLDIEALPPIGNAIETTALQKLFFSSDDVVTLRNEIHGSMTFPYAGHVIHLRADGTVSVYESI